MSASLVGSEMCIRDSRSTRSVTLSLRLMGSSFLSAPSALRITIFVRLSLRRRLSVFFFPALRPGI
eukprot:1732664-Alexandrium_andersonii.AAC.1